MLFRPIRSLILIGAAFLAGFLYARNQISTECSANGGTMAGPVCEVRQ